MGTRAVPGESVSCLCPTLCDSMVCPRGPPGKNTRVGLPFPSLGDLPNFRGSNPDLLH